MKTQNTTTGAGNSTAAQVNEQIKFALTQWAKLVRQDADMNCIEAEGWLLAELAILFRKLAEQNPQAAFDLIEKETQELKQSMRVSKVMQTL